VESLKAPFFPRKVAPERCGHNESPAPCLLSRTFSATEVDAVKRALGIVKDLATGSSSPTTREAILSLHEQGCGVCEIARRSGLSRKCVGRLLLREGIECAVRTPASAHLGEIIRLRGEGRTLAEIGTTLGHSAKAIGRAMHKQGRGVTCPCLT
jgi:hypothetical protein